MLSGKVAIVTGASGGIGSVTALALAREGVRVVLAAPQSEVGALQALAARMEGTAFVVPTDVTVRSDVDRLVQATIERFGRIDVLANVAGIGSSPSLCDDSDEKIASVLAVNLLGTARMIHAVLPAMKAQRSGSIVNIGSVAGEVGIIGIYSASKFGVRGLSDSVRREVRSLGIGVTLIEPGFVRTSMNAAMGDGLPPPEIVADAIVRAAKHPRRRVIVPFWYHVPVFFATYAPWLLDLVFGDARIQDRLNRDSRAGS
ncbi:MAG: SDR family NAD(P)-dependent oxidoreductase [Candidatus Eremiobacteraeota bacterium]|nr:SDR family NAD(P)-dependent oxidoreductase [Candidatus Eremiobacteraeota bacterium]